MFILKNIHNTLLLPSLFLALVATNLNVGFASQVRNNTYPVKLAQSSQENDAENQSFVENNDFQFQLLSCQRKNKTVNCSFLIKNIANSDRQLHIHGTTRAFDSSGNEYPLISSSLGKNQSSNILVKGIAIKAGLTFEIPVEVKELALLEFPYMFQPTTSIPKVEFRNVKIRQSKSSGTAR